MTNEQLACSLRSNIATLKLEQHSHMSRLRSVQLALHALEHELLLCERDWATLPKQFELKPLRGMARVTSVRSAQPCLALPVAV